MNLPATLESQIDYFIKASLSANTRKSYASDCRIFADWCVEHALAPFPAAPATVAAFLADQAATCSAATLSRRLAALTRLHRARNLPPPIDDRVRAVLAGIRRDLGIAAKARTPLVADDLVKILSCLKSDLTDCRDRALLLIGWFGALRRSELVALCVEHIEHKPQGLVLSLPKSKTDQNGEGQSIAVPRAPGRHWCPVSALHAWLERAHIEHGPIFRRIRGKFIYDEALSPGAVAWIVKTRAGEAGLETDLLSAHSLRSGALTSGALSGANLHKLRELSRHKSLNSLSKYVRPVEIFQNHALAKILG